MGAKGFYIAEEGHYVPLIMPHDQSGAAHASSVIRMKDYNHADIIVSIGATILAAGVITLESCDNMTPSVHTEIPFNYYVSTAVFGSASDDIWMPVTKLTATTGIIPGAVGPAAGTTGVTYLIALDAEQLVEGHIGFRLNIANPAGASIGSAFAILSGERYGVNPNTVDV